MQKKTRRKKPQRRRKKIYHFKFTLPAEASAKAGKTMLHTMPVRFSTIQHFYPDAIRMIARRFKNAQPFSEEELAKMVGGGKILLFDTTPTSQTIVCSKAAEKWSKIEVYYGPAASGKSLHAREVMSLYQPDQSHEITWKDALEQDWSQSSLTVLAVDEVPACINFGVLVHKFKGPKHVIVMIQTSNPLYKVDFPGIESRKFGGWEYVSTDEQK